MINKLLFAVLLCLPLFVMGQEEEIPTKSAAHLFNLGIGLDFPFGDMKDRFARANKISGGYNFLTSNDWTYGVDVSFFYGDRVKEDVLAPLRNERGSIINGAESFSQAFLRERGYYIGGEFGKVFSIKSKYRSGIKTTLGAGILQHKIRVVDNDQNSIRLFGERKKGYDRLTRGLAVRQYVGYHHLSVNRRVNYSVGLEFTQGFTSAVRGLDWDTGLAGDSNRFDFTVGLKAVWVLPFWSGKSNEEIYY